MKQKSIRFLSIAGIVVVSVLILFSILFLFTYLSGSILASDMGYHMGLDDMWFASDEELLYDDEFEYARVDNVVFYPDVGFRDDDGNYRFGISIQSDEPQDVYISEVCVLLDGKTIISETDIRSSLLERTYGYQVYIDISVMNEDDIGFSDGAILQWIVYVGEERVQLNYEMVVEKYTWDLAIAQ